MAAGNKEISELEENIENTEALQQFIKERKNQLVQEALKHLGKSKYLQKINKEAFYYTETLRNYKEIFSDKKKAEEAALALLNKIPLFKKFMRENSMLASLFGTAGTTAGNLQSLAGLQTRASVNSLIQNRISTGGPNALQQVQQNIQQAQAEMNVLKNRISKYGSGANADTELPDFKPNAQKTKTFIQRIEYAVDLQPQRGIGYIPSGLNVGANIGYKLNDKSIIGVGVAYKLGIGSIERIKLSNQGMGLRSFLDWKLKKKMYLSGGYEMSQFRIDEQLLQPSIVVSGWARSGLIGFSKKYKVGKKKEGKTQLLWDFLSYQQLPKTQPVIIRFGLPL